MCKLTLGLANVLIWLCLVSVTVAVRARPLNGAKEQAVVSMHGQNVTVQDGAHKFAFDFSFAQDTPQQEVYRCLGPPVLEDAFAGFNSCIFAYGQTGAGKSHTMMGTGREYDAGLIPRLC